MQRFALVVGYGVLTLAFWGLTSTLCVNPTTAGDLMGLKDLLMEGSTDPGDLCENYTYLVK
jgi:hypothetical protein